MSLLDAARDVRERAYVPYSKFKVGAAIRGASGTVYRGCNVENVAYPEGTCAEAGAIAAMVAAGETVLTEVDVIADSPSPVPPCGGCRQKLAEFGAGDVPVLLAGLPAPGNYGPDFARDFEGMYVDLAAQYDAVLVPDFLGPIGEKATQGLSLADLMQDDSIHPNAEGVRQIVDAIGPEVEALLARADQ